MEKEQKKGKGTIIFIILVMIIAVAAIAGMGVLYVKTENEKNVAKGNETVLSAKVSELEKSQTQLQAEINKLKETKSNTNTNTTTTKTENTNTTETKTTSTITFDSVAGAYKYVNNDKYGVICLYSNGSFVYNMCDAYGGIIGNYTIANDTIILNKLIQTTTSTDVKTTSGQAKMKYNNGVLTIDKAEDIDLAFTGTISYNKEATDRYASQDNLSRTITSLIKGEI